jgi:hypothetical protein
LGHVVAISVAVKGLVFDPPGFLSFGIPTFTVTSGPCTTAFVDGHFCVGRWPGGYLPNEHCDILVGGGGGVGGVGGGGPAGGVLGPCPVFDTSGEDILALPGGAAYSRWRCPAGVVLAAGDALSWFSNGAGQGNPSGGGNGLPNSGSGAGGGWQICFA